MLIILSYLSLIVFGICDNSRGPLYSSIIAEFQIDNSSGAFFFSLGSISGLLTGISSIFFIDRINKKYLWLLSSLGLFGTFLVIGMSSSIKQVFLGSFLFGITAGLLGILPNAIVPKVTNIHNRQRILSGLHSMYGISSLIAPSLIAFLLTQNFSWRQSFQIISIAPLGLFIFLLLCPQHFFYIKEYGESAEDKEFDYKIFLNKKLVNLCLVLSFAVLAEVLISSRLVYYLEDAKGLSTPEASMYLSYFFLFLLLGRILFGLVKFKVVLDRQIYFLIFASFMAILLGQIYHFFCFSLAGFFIAPLYPLVSTKLAESFSFKVDKIMSFAVSINSLSLASMHLFIGKMTDLFTIKYSFLFSLLFLLLSFILLLISNKKTRLK